MAKISKPNVVDGVAECVSWWIETRREKLVEQLSESMAVNPFLAPFLFEFHSVGSVEALIELLVAGHMMIGHATGFGKLIDEKVLPKVFGTTKLDSKFRKNNPPYNQHLYDEIDHLIVKGNVKSLLSVKASRWTIQLTMAVQLNSAFDKIISTRRNENIKIVVGVLYGKSSALTDKYDILRGINRGANHNVKDLTKHVTVVSGRDFWSQLNENTETQEWVLEGIIQAIKNSKEIKNCSQLFNKYKSSIRNEYNDHISKNGEIDWAGILKKING